MLNVTYIRPMYIKKLKPTSLHLNLRWDHYKSILFWLQISEAMVALNFPPRFGDSEGWPTNTFAKSNLLLNFEKHKSSYSGQKFVTFKKKNSVPKDLLNTIKCYILPVAEVLYSTCIQNIYFQTSSKNNLFSLDKTVSI